MNLVKTYIDKSPIEGIGLFASEFIKEGTKVWVLNEFDKIFTYSEIKHLPSVFKEHVLKYAYTEDGNYILCGDNAIFYNHSKTPNVWSIGQFEIAKKDIQIGEEMTCDYFKINDDHSRDIFKLLI